MVRPHLDGEGEAPPQQRKETKERASGEGRYRDKSEFLSDFLGKVSYLLSTDLGYK